MTWPRRDPRRSLRSSAPRARRARSRRHREHSASTSSSCSSSPTPATSARSTPAETRLELTRLAFEERSGSRRSSSTSHARTVDSLEERRPEDAVFSSARDELADFESWKQPAACPRARLARRRDAAGRPRGRAARASALGSPHPTASRSSTMQPMPVSSSEIRARVASRRADRRARAVAGRRRDRASRPVRDA